jgi:hypothetical protein
METTESDKISNCLYKMIKLYYQKELDNRMKSPTFLRRGVIHLLIEKYDSTYYIFDNKLDLAIRIMEDIPEIYRDEISLTDIMEELTLIGPLKSSCILFSHIPYTILNWR